MEKKILQGTTICLGILTIGICVCLYSLPSMKEQLDFWPGFMGQETAIEIEGVTAELEKEQLNIELPENIEGKDITITNDYLTQTIYVKFKNGVDNYSENYSVKGGSNHIANLSYYKEGDLGVLAVQLDKVCEMSYSYKDGYLCINIMDPHDIYDKIIVVDAGHGGRMPGAVKKGVYEKTINLEIVKQLKEIFDEVDDESIKVYYTRLTDTNPSLKERADLANYTDADLFISIHNNASSSGMFNNDNGTLILYSPDDSEEQLSKRLAEICMDNITETAGSKSKGIVDGNDIYVVRYSEVPVVLIEVGFMTNTKELDNLTNPEYQKKVAQGIYNGIMQAFEEGF